MRPLIFINRQILEDKLYSQNDEYLFLFSPLRGSRLGLFLFAFFLMQKGKKIVFLTNVKIYDYVKKIRRIKSSVNPVIYDLKSLLLINNKSKNKDGSIYFCKSLMMLLKCLKDDISLNVFLVAVNPSVNINREQLNSVNINFLNCKLQIPEIFIKLLKTINKPVKGVYMDFKMKFKEDDLYITNYDINENINLIIKDIFKITENYIYKAPYNFYPFRITGMWLSNNEIPIGSPLFKVKEKKSKKYIYIFTNGALAIEN